MAKSDGQQQDQHHGQGTHPAVAAASTAASLPPPPNPPFRFPGMPYPPPGAPMMMRPPIATQTTTALKPGATAIKPAALPPFPAPANANMTTLPPTAAGAAAPKYYYNRPFPPPPPPPPYNFTAPPPSLANKSKIIIDKRGQTSSFQIAAAAAALAAAKTESSTYAMRKMNDTDFVRCFATEFKRRGYTLAIQLKPYSAEVKEPAKKKLKGTQNNNDGEVSTGKGVEKATQTSTAAATTTSPNKSSPSKQKLLPSLSLPSFTFYPTLRIPNAKQDATWDAMYDQVCDYVKKNNGDLPLLATINDDNADNRRKHEALYRWTRTQLSSWDQMKKDSMHTLSLERISKLHVLNFEQHHVASATATAASSTSEPTAATAPTAAAALPAAASVSSVVVGTAPPDSRNVWIQSMKNLQRWKEKFESLKRYKELHGDINVPPTVDEALVTWCETQRIRRKVTLSDKGDAAAAAAGEGTLTDSRANPLTKEQFQLLESFGFETVPPKRKRNYTPPTVDRAEVERKWEEKFQELIQFKEVHGHCDVSYVTHADNLPLANWVKRQRKKYKARQSGMTGSKADVTDEHIMKLGSVGFSFTRRDDFETRFIQVCQFKKEFGHTRVPNGYKRYNNLGRWTKRWREGIRKNEPWVDQNRKTRLVAIGFDVAARPGYGHKPKNSDVDQAVAATTTHVMDNPDFDPSEHPFESAGDWLSSTIDSDSD